MESQTQTQTLLSTRASQVAILGLRVLTSIFLVLSLAILVSNNFTEYTGRIVNFSKFVPYRYMAAAIVIGIAYSVFQTGVVVIRLRRENQGNLLLDFYGDKVISNILATGAVAGFVMTAQIQRDSGDKDYYVNKYIKRSHAADGLVFIAFICTFIFSVLSSYALPKKVYYN